MNSIWAVVPAAGSGRRLGGEIPKQYREIAGAPLMEHTLRALLESPDIRGVVVALDPAVAAKLREQRAGRNMQGRLRRRLLRDQHLDVGRNKECLQMHIYTRQEQVGQRRAPRSRLPENRVRRGADPTRRGVPGSDPHAGLRDALQAYKVRRRLRCQGQRRIPLPGRPERQDESHLETERRRHAVRAHLVPRGGPRAQCEAVC